MKSFALAVVIPYLPLSSQLTKIPIYLFLVLGITATKRLSQAYVQEQISSPDSFRTYVAVEVD